MSPRTNIRCWTSFHLKALPAEAPAEADQVDALPGVRDPSQMVGPAAVDMGKSRPALESFHPGTAEPGQTLLAKLGRFLGEDRRGAFRE